MSIVKVDTLMLVLHFKVSTEGWIGHNLLIILHPSVINFITVEHGDLLEVLQSRLKSSINHHILLHKLHVCIFILFSELLCVSNQKRIL